MPAKFVVVPQWQGSSSSRSMRLIDGAEAIRGDLPAASTTLVEIPLGAGDAVGTRVHRYSSLAVVRERLRQTLDALTDGDVPVVIGGDCGVELGAIEHALARSPGLAVVWFDAHADLNTPESSTSGAFHGMVARAVLGEGAEGLAAKPGLAADRLVLAGTRAFDAAEETLLGEVPIRHVPVERIAEVVDAVAASGADAVYVHVDLDVLDPGELACVDFPEPFGVTTADLAAAIRGLTARFPLAGAGITEFAPPGADEAREDLPAILRLLSAITAATRSPRPAPSTPGDDAA